MNKEYLLTDDSKALLKILKSKIDSPANNYIEMAYKAALDEGARVLANSGDRVKSFKNLNAIRRLQDELARYLVHQMDVAYCWQNQFADND
jgi:hypothetical protein